MFRGYRRDVISLTIESIYEEIANSFIDGIQFIIIDENNGVEEEFVYDNYSLSGTISDYRNGTILIKMGKVNIKRSLTDVYCGNNGIKRKIFSSKKSIVIQLKFNDEVLDYPMYIC